MFFCEFCEISTNTFFYRTLLVDASECSSKENVSPIDIYLFQINDGNTRKMCETPSELTKKTPEWPSFVLAVLNFIAIFVQSEQWKHLKSFDKPRGKHLYWSLFFNNVTSLRAGILSKQKFLQRCFLVNFEKLLRTAFLKKTFGSCFCTSPKSSVNNLHEVTTKER